MRRPTPLRRALRCYPRAIMKCCTKRLSASVTGLLVLSFFAVALATEPPETLFYTRAEVMAATTGEATLRRVYAQQLELPSAFCDAAPFSCVKRQHYGQVYSVEFAQEVVTRGADGTASVDRRERGRVTIAVSLPKEQEDRFEGALRAFLQGLGAAEYADPWAGIRFSAEPLDQPSLEWSTAPAWVCHQLDGVYRFDLQINDDERAWRTYARAGSDAEKACRTLTEAVGDSEPDSIRTLPAIHSQVLREVRLVSSSTLGGLTWADRLASIPDGATFKKARLEGDRRTGAIRDGHDGVFRGHEGRYGGVERDVRLPRASLDLTEHPMWVTRWTFDSLRQQFGDAPSSERDPSVWLDVAVVPISDPLMDGLERSEIELSVPEDRVIAAALARLIDGAQPGPALLREALADPEIWPSRGDWLVVACRDDGSARYGLAPFAEAAEVTNPREACAAIRRVIERAQADPSSSSSRPHTSATNSMLWSARRASVSSKSSCGAIS